MNNFDKKKLPSRHTTLGPERAPHRSFYYAMNLKKEDVVMVGDWPERDVADTQCLRHGSCFYLE